MSKCVISILLLVAMLFAITYAGAEDLSKMSTEELIQLRQDINNELAARAEQATLEAGKTIIDVFPDKNIAIKMRDEMGAFSINDPVTDEMLESVTYIFINDMNLGIESLEGVQYLPKLKSIEVIYEPTLTQLPDLSGLKFLYELDFTHCGLTELPDWICNCQALEKIEVDFNPVKNLPENIGNLSTLKELDISYTEITELPASIKNLKLKEFNRKGLDLGD